MFKRIMMVVLAAVALLSFSMVAWGEDEPSYRGELTGMGGTKSMGQLDYQLGEHFSVAAFSENGLSNLGLGFQPFNWLAIKGGYTYDSAIQESFPFGELKFDLPFGTNNLRLSGSYDYDYYGKDWSTYEAALRIQMYQHIFLYAGVRGDAGDLAPSYSYNQDREAMLFLRGQLGWTFGKWELDLEPLLYLNGTLLHDYTVKYHLNDRVNLMVNGNTLYENQDFYYRAGFQIKF